MRSSSLRFVIFEDECYELGEYTIAANHAHVLVRPAWGFDLSEILHSWKRHTSSELRRLPDTPHALRAGRHFWQVESFDHIVRSERSLEKFTTYIRNHE